MQLLYVCMYCLLITLTCGPNCEGHSSTGSAECERRPLAATKQSRSNPGIQQPSQMSLTWVKARPLLFLIYINDLPECLRSTTPCIYADDTQIFSSSYDANELVVKLNSDLARIRNWLIENKLQMHPYKSKFIFIG